MGLGKTLQVIAFIDVFLQHTAATTVLCVVPVSSFKLALYLRLFRLYFLNNCIQIKLKVITNNVKT